MLKKLSLARALLPTSILLAALAATGCATPMVSANGLELRRVVVYRNGVGYFERQGRVDEDHVTFRVRREKVGDFLATLAVIEKGGSSVRSASFPLEVADDAEPEDEGPADKYEILLKPPPPKSKKDAKDPLERVRLTLDGREHDLIVGYVAETPVWRPSYRLVITDEKGKDGQPAAELQAWGIVQNLSGEDWKQVKLSLVAGAPLAFQSTLDKPVVPPRPVVTDRGEVIASVPGAETSLAQEEAAGAPPPPPPPAPSMPMGAAEAAPAADMDTVAPGKGDGWGRGRAAPKRSSRLEAQPRAGAAGAAPVTKNAERMDMPRQNPSPPRNVSALAAVALEGGTTRYDLPFAVDVPDKSATMVLLTSRQVPGQAIFLFSPDGGVPDSGFHPFRVARFVNMTGGLLERGPIAVFERGAFLGQGMVDPLPPGAAATVPFALERGVSVESQRSDDQQGARLAKLEAGAIEIERDQVLHTKYKVKNGLEEPVKILVKHLRSPGTRLHDPPKQTEDNVGTGSALVPLGLGKHATATLDVDERRTFRMGVDPLSQLADDAVRGYVADPRADRALAKSLSAAWEIRDKLKRATDERDVLEREREEIERTTEELRRNLRAIEKNKQADDLRRDLTDRLAKASSRHDEIEKREITLRLQIAEQSIRMRDLLNALRLAEPLPIASGG